MGITSTTLFGASLLESSITKVFGGLIAAFLVAWIVCKFIIPGYLRWLAVGKRQTKPTRILRPTSNRRVT